MTFFIDSFQRQILVGAFQLSDAENKARLFSETSEGCIERLNFPWTNEENKVDCGIYTIRHMETYFGDAKIWDSGIRNDKLKEQMKILRRRYLHQLLDSEYNEVRDHFRTMKSKKKK